MKKILVLALALVFALAGMAAAQDFVSLATGGTGGTYYPIGGGIADIVSRNVDGLQMTAETGNASVANLNLIGTNQIEMALVQNDVAYFAYNGEMMFDEPYKNVRAIGTLYPETIQVVAMKDSGVRTIHDLPGKRVSVGAPGSGVLADVQLIFRVLGFKFGDMDTDFLDFNNTADRMKDGQLDVGFVVAGWPTAAIMDLATRHDITLVEFDESFIDELNSRYPFFTKNIVPAGTYTGVDKDTVTAAVQAMWVCDASMSEDAVYKITKAFWDNVEDLYQVHSKAKLVTIETALDGVSVPVHPGAAKYYREIGLEVPEIE